MTRLQQGKAPWFQKKHGANDYEQSVKKLFQNLLIVVRSKK
jgi:hypothetical protein